MEYIIDKGYINLIISFCIHRNEKIAILALQIIYSAIIEYPVKSFYVTSSLLNNINFMIILHCDDQKICILLRKFILYLNKGIIIIIIDPFIRHLLLESKIIDTINLLFSKNKDCENCLYTCIKRII